MIGFDNKNCTPVFTKGRYGQYEGRYGQYDVVLSLVYTPVADCRRQSLGSATVADSRARVYTSAGDCRQRKWATVVSSRRL